MTGVVMIAQAEAPQLDEEVAATGLVELLGLEDMPLVMSPKTLGEILELNVMTLLRWRKTWPLGDRLGPAFFEPEGMNMIRYSRKDVVEWLRTAHVSGQPAGQAVAS